HRPTGWSRVPSAAANRREKRKTAHGVCLPRLLSNWRIISERHVLALDLGDDFAVCLRGIPCLLPLRIVNKCLPRLCSRVEAGMRKDLDQCGGLELFLSR